MLDIDLNSIDSKKIQVKFTSDALEQIKLMMTHDYTVKGKSLRVQIGGKGCSGFTYQIGFDDIKENDYQVERPEFTILMQPFVAYFCKDIEIDYLVNDEGLDGFTVVNNDQSEYEGKFFE